MSLFENIQNNLPNFPNEVIRDWLEPIAKIYRWPPSNEKWESILILKNIEFWKNIKWKKQIVNLDEIDFTVETKCIIKGLYDAYIYEQENLHSNIENGKERYLKSLSYLLKNGKFPKPICFLREKNQFYIVDGNHRFVAWVSALRIVNEIVNSEKKMELKKRKLIQEKLGVELIIPTAKEQEVWIASS